MLLIIDLNSESVCLKGKMEKKKNLDKLFKKQRKDGKQVLL